MALKEANLVKSGASALGAIRLIPRAFCKYAITTIHGSFPPNLLIAEVLFKTGLLESWGSGAKRIIDACEQQNLPSPEWSSDGGFVRVIFKRPSKEQLEAFALSGDQTEAIKSSVTEEKTDQTSDQTGNQTSGKSNLTAPKIDQTYAKSDQTNNVNSSVTEEKSDQRVAGRGMESEFPLDDEIYSLVKENSKITRAKIVKITGRSEGAVQRSLFRLKKKGLIERVGGKFGGHWLVK